MQVVVASVVPPELPAQWYGPPAKTPAPFMILEKAMCSGTARLRCVSWTRVARTGAQQDPAPPLLHHVSDPARRATQREQRGRRTPRQPQRRGHRHQADVDRGKLMKLAGGLRQEQGSGRP